MNKYALFITVLIVVIAVGLLPGCGNNNDEKEIAQKQMIGAYNLETEIQYFQMAKCKFELSTADNAVVACLSQEMNFLVSTGYSEEYSLNIIQKKWKSSQWKKYALIMERLNEALIERDQTKDAYYYTLNKLGFDKHSFNIWYARTIGGSSDPKAFIDSKLGIQ